MAQFCTKCGTPLQEGMRFCLGCGAAIGASATPATPSPGVQPPVAPMAPLAVSPIGEVSTGAAPALTPPVPSKSSPVLKIVLIVVAVLIFFGMLSAGACVYFVYRAKQRVSQYEKQVRSSIAAQARASQPSTEPSAPASPERTSSVVDTGIPVYPGATASRARMKCSEWRDSGCNSTPPAIRWIKFWPFTKTSWGPTPW